MMTLSHQPLDDTLKFPATCASNEQRCYLYRLYLPSLNISSMNERDEYDSIKFRCRYLKPEVKR